MSENTNDIVTLFPADDIPFILETVLDKCSALFKKEQTEREDRVSKRLFRLLQRDQQFRNGPWLIDREVTVCNPDFNEEQPEVRLDFRVITHGAWDFRTYFAIEAKRLNVMFSDGIVSLATEYVKDGMMRFVNQKYSPYMLSAAMLGYVFEGDINGALDNVARAIQRKAKSLKLARSGKLSSSNVLPGNQVHETQHDLQPRHFILYHLFVAV